MYLKFFSHQIRHGTVHCGAVHRCSTMHVENSIVKVVTALS